MAEVAEKHRWWPRTTARVGQVSNLKVYRRKASWYSAGLLIPHW